jgi:hypothetical protein
MLGFLNRVCESKTSYPSVLVALRAKHLVMTRAAASKAKAVAGCDPYRCQFCGAIHLGHSIRSVPSEAGR